MSHDSQAPVSYLFCLYKLQAEEAGGPTPSPPKKRTAAPRPKAGVRPNKRSRGDTAASDQDGSDTEPKSKNAKKSRPTSKLKAKETKVDKAPRKKSGSKSKDSRNKPAISAVSLPRALYRGHTKVSRGGMI